MRKLFILILLLIPFSCYAGMSGGVATRAAVTRIIYAPIAPNVTTTSGTDTCVISIPSAMGSFQIVRSETNTIIIRIIKKIVAVPDTGVLEIP